MKTKRRTHFQIVRRSKWARRWIGSKNDRFVLCFVGMRWLSIGTLSRLVSFGHRIDCQTFSNITIRSRWSGRARICLDLFLCPCTPVRVIHGSILEKCSKHEHKAHDQINVDGLDVGNARQWRTYSRTDRGHCEHCGDAESYTSGCGLQWNGKLESIQITQSRHSPRGWSKKKPKTTWRSVWKADMFER